MSRLKIIKGLAEEAAEMLSSGTSSKRLSKIGQKKARDSRNAEILRNLKDKGPELNTKTEDLPTEQDMKDILGGFKDIKDLDKSAEFASPTRWKSWDDLIATDLEDAGLRDLSGKPLELEDIESAYYKNPDKVYSILSKTGEDEDINNLIGYLRRKESTGELEELYKPKNVVDLFGMKSRTGMKLTRQDLQEDIADFKKLDKSKDWAIAKLLSIGYPQKFIMEEMKRLWK